MKMFNISILASGSSRRDCKLKPCQCSLCQVPKHSFTCFESEIPTMLIGTVAVCARLSAMRLVLAENYRWEDPLEGKSLMSANVSCSICIVGSHQRYPVVLLILIVKCSSISSHLYHFRLRHGLETKLRLNVAADDINFALKKEEED